MRCHVKGCSNTPAYTHCTPHRLYTPVCYSFIHSEWADIFRVYAVLSCLCLYSASRSAWQWREVATVPLSGIVAVPQVIIINEQHARYLHDLPVHITHVSSQQPQQRQRRQIRRITARGRWWWWWWWWHAIISDRRSDQRLHEHDTVIVHGREVLHGHVSTIVVYTLRSMPARNRSRHKSA